ncbi:MAG: SEL1-like repeat protein [Oscillospiraceae bacterium]|nr:SEL1-like repeat protein [Oscillospiraceae bacterium]
MALIKCPECGKEISDKSSACIHCGYPINETSEKQNAVSSIVSSVDGQKQSEVEKYVLLGDDLRIAEKYQDALDRYTKAANLGSAYAQLWIGNFYSRGLGVEQNQSEAAKWYQKAAEQGNVDALVNLAILYKNGTGVEKNIDKAIELDLQAIQMGSALAAGNLGSLYEFASSEYQSYPLARKYYEAAISLGTNEYAVYNNLALIYADGKGTAVDYAKAEMYYIKAIELGSKQAKQNYSVFANNRGVAYADGKGVAKDYAKAEAYYLKAIKYGNQQAKSNYDALKKSLATTQQTASPPSPQTSGVNGKVVGIIVAIVLILVCWFIGTISDNSDKTNTRTCAWCNGTGYNGNGAQSPEEYVFKKTPCTHCGGDGKY